MVTMYLCFLAGGAVLPIISFIFGAFGDGADVDVDTDVDIGTGVDIGTDLDVDTGVDIGADVDVDTDMDIDTDVDAGVVADISTTADLNMETGSDLGTGADTVFSIGLLPTSLMSLSALAITFGAVGGVMSLTGKGKIITFVAALIAGYLASVVVQTIVKTLKNIQKGNTGINENELMLYDGKIVDTILPGQLGSVSFTTLKNVMVSYPAKCSDESLKLETGRIVKVKEMKNGIFLVEPKNKYE